MERGRPAYSGVLLHINIRSSAVLKHRGPIVRNRVKMLLLGILSVCIALSAPEVPMRHAEEGEI